MSLAAEQTFFIGLLLKKNLHKENILSTRAEFFLSKKTSSASEKNFFMGCRKERETDGIEKGLKEDFFHIFQC